MTWTINYEYIVAWLDEQNKETVADIFAALEVLQREGPALGRPLVDVIEGSQVANLKELRPASPGRTEIRILFAFDPQRTAVLLFAGDKAKGKRGQALWSRWYKKAIPKAERLYLEHLNDLEQEHEDP